MALSRRFSSAASLLLLVAATALGCEIRSAPPPAAPQAPAAPLSGGDGAVARSTADIVAAALPAVVLLIHEHPARPGVPATTTFGAGFLTRDGLVVTSLHVIGGEGKVSAMLHKPGRQSYTPMDGGLMRFLFENQADLVPVTRVAADAVTDLAVLRVEADTSHLPKLVWSDDAVRAGDRVLALGHPQETVWSFSEGVVGALQYGILQHTALVGPGSSGGPLLNAKGEVVGVNVAKVMSEPTGLSFARPIAIVASTFSDKKVASPLDQSTPAAAALSCWRAQELALSDTGDCFDWDREWEDYKKAAEEAKRGAATAEIKDAIDGCHLAPQARSAWLLRAREHAIHMFDPDYDKGKGEGQHGAISPGDKPSPAESSSVDVCGPAQPTPVESAFIADYKNPKKLAERLRNGLRVEQTHLATPALAWVLLASRAADGAVAQFTELYSKVGDKWLQRMAPTADEIAAVPPGWPAPLTTGAAKRPLLVAKILREAAEKDRCPFTPKATDAAASTPGGSGRAVLRMGL